MNATRKTSETATVLRAGRSKATVSNDAAKTALKTGVKKTAAGNARKRERVMVNTPVDMMPLIRADAEETGVTMSTWYVLAAKEKLAKANGK
jgi:hypothetical protein